MADGAEPRQGSASGDPQVADKSADKAADKSLALRTNGSEADDRPDMLRWLMTREYAQAVEDVIWRRTRLGLHLTPDQVAVIRDWMAQHRREGVEPH